MEKDAVFNIVPPTTSIHRTSLSLIRKRDDGGLPVAEISDFAEDVQLELMYIATEIVCKELIVIWKQRFFTEPRLMLYVP